GGARADRHPQPSGRVRGLPALDLRRGAGRDHDPAPAGPDPERSADARAAGGGSRPGCLAEALRRRQRRGRGDRRYGDGGRMTALLEVSGLKKSFGGLAALDGLNLEVNEGEIVSVIGPNGAGKTTF